MNKIQLNLLSNSLIMQIAAICLIKEAKCNIAFKYSSLKSHARLFSINSSSQKLLQKIGIWGNIPTESIVPYERINVFSQDRTLVTFNAKDINSKYLGFIINENDLVKSIHEIFRSLETPFKEKNESNHYLNISSNPKIIGTTKMNVDFHTKDYDQTAINMYIKHTLNNNLIPSQIFHKNEVLGFLPISNDEYNLIWSLPNKTYSEISKSKNYIKYLEERSEFLIGKVEDLKIGNSFPLFAKHAMKYCFDNTVLIGDAAHKFHPLAGLGLNMGIEDVITLTNLINNYDNKRIIQREFAIRRVHRNKALQRILDLIINFYSTELFPDSFKSLMLNLFNHSIILKSNITKEATGYNQSINK